MNILLQEKEVIDMGQLQPELSLKCLSGRIWVTCQGDQRDHLLKPGMEYCHSSKGKVVVWALTEASLCVLNPECHRHDIPIGRLLQA